jgi:Holliday junction resolvase RuvA-like protein
MNGIRLRCRAHSQYATECAFGTEFMRCKREEAQRAAQEHGVAAQARARADAAADEIKEDVICALKNLGYRADEACRAVDWCDGPDASFEQRVRGALFFLQKPCHRRAAKIPATAI